MPGVIPPPSQQKAEAGGQYKIEARQQEVNKGNKIFVKLIN
jgi:hypothetical protein